REILHAFVFQFGKEAMQRDGVRRCVAKRSGSLRADKTDGAHACSPVTLGFPNLSKKNADRRLSVRTGNGCDCFRLCGEMFGSEECQAASWILVRDETDAERFRFLAQVRFAEHGRCAAMHRLRNESAAIVPRARQC